jgi:methyltransferase family protein
MHAEAYLAVRRMIQRSGINREEPWTALDIGGAYWNGSARPELPNADWTIIDLEGSPAQTDAHDWNQYVVADATTWRPEDDAKFHVVLCTEVFEHLADWVSIIETAHAVLHLDGIFIVTCASMGRTAHGATGAPAPAEGEWYANVHENDLRWTLENWFLDVHVEYAYPPGDAYALARNPR